MKSRRICIHNKHGVIARSASDPFYCTQGGSELTRTTDEAISNFVPCKDCFGCTRNEGREDGFTLTEILIVISLIGIISTFALAMSLDTYRSYNFRSEQASLLSLLQKARNQAMNNIDQSPHGVHVANSQYVLYEGGDWLSRDVSKDVSFNIGNGITTTGMSDVIFSQLRGNPVAAGNIILADSVHAPATFSINSEGQINY